MKRLKLCLIVLICIVPIIVQAAGMPEPDTLGKAQAAPGSVHHFNGVTALRNPDGVISPAVNSLRVIVRLQKQSIRQSISERYEAKKTFHFRKLKERNRQIRGELFQRLGKKKVPHWEKLHRKSPRSLWLANSLALTVTPDEIQDLLEDPAVAEVLPNIVLSIPPLEGLSAGDPDEVPTLWNHAAVGVDAVRSLGLDGTGIRIGLLDSGVDDQHPDLRGKLIAWREFEASGNMVPSSPHETHDSGHGTHVASIMVGAEAGLAPGADLIAALVLSEGNGTLEQVLAGMQWVLDPDEDPTTDDGAQIVNMSWGFQGTSSALREAVQNMVAAGVLPIAAIGNRGQGITYCPGNVPEAVGVGAVDATDSLPFYSGGGVACWGESCITKPDVTAPGTEIFGAGPSGTYQFLSGTSMAAPHVAAAAAILLQYKPSLPLTELRDYLVNSSKDLGDRGHDERYGWGRLDLASAAEFSDLYAARVGRPDLVIENHYNFFGVPFYQYHTFFSDGAATFLNNESDVLTLWSYDPSCDLETLGMGDMDGDGYSDLAVAEICQHDNGIFAIRYDVYPSRGSRGFSKTATPFYSFDSMYPDSSKLIGIADVNGDAKSDLVFYRMEESRWKNYIRIFVLLSTGTRFIESIPADSEDWAQIGIGDKDKFAIGLGDLNGDGKSDLAITKTIRISGYYPIMEYYIGLSDGVKFAVSPEGSYFPQSPSTGSLGFHSVADVNGDRFADILFANQENHTTEVFAALSSGYGYYYPPVRWANVRGNSQVNLEKPVDLNEDGAGDLVISHAAEYGDPYRLAVWLANERYEAFFPTENVWFTDSGGVVPDAMPQIVRVADVGLGVW